MAEIRRTVDREGQPSFNYRTTLELLAEQLYAERCLIFLGAGASIDQTQPDLPTARELSRLMAGKCGLDWHEYVPLSTTAFFYEFFYTREKLNRFLVQRIADASIQPTSTITTLIEIIGKLEAVKKRCLVMTTNYDQLFEQAYTAARGRPPGVIVYRGANDPRVKGAKLHDGLNSDPEYWLPDQLTYLYKMHGCISNPGDQNLVITEEDYINFLTNALHQHEDKRLLHYVRGRLALSTVLFVGYSLSDWNFRVVFKATTEEKSSTSFAVQLNSDTQGNEQEKARQEALIKFWGNRRIDIINADGSAFMKDLLRQMESFNLQAAGDR